MPEFNGTCELCGAQILWHRPPGGPYGAYEPDLPTMRHVAACTWHAPAPAVMDDPEVEYDEPL